VLGEQWQMAHPRRQGVIADRPEDLEVGAYGPQRRALLELPLRDHDPTFPALLDEPLEDDRLHRAQLSLAAEVGPPEIQPALDLLLTDRLHQRQHLALVPGEDLGHRRGAGRSRWGA